MAKFSAEHSTNQCDSPERPIGGNNRRDAPALRATPIPLALPLLKKHRNGHSLCPSRPRDLSVTPWGLGLRLQRETEPPGERGMRKLFAVVTMASTGAALVACTERPPSAINSTSANSMAYERPAPIVRAPLAPAQGYASPPPLGGPPPLASPYGNPPVPAPFYGNAPQYGADPQTAALDGWRASPRWSAVQGNGCIEVEQAGEGTPEAPGAAPRMKVESCAKAAAGARPPAETMAPPDY